MTDPSNNRRSALTDTRLRWVPLDQMRVSPEGQGQRNLKQYRVDKLIAKGFDPDIMGYPVVSERDGWFWIIDGQARVEALKLWLRTWAGQQVQCRLFTGLTVEQESELFLRLNDFTSVGAWPKFHNAVKAGRILEADVDRIVRLAGLMISRDRSETSIGAVSTLQKIYTRAGGPIMGRAIRIARDAYGKPGLEGPVLDGLSLLCQRYNGELEESTAVTRLSAAHGGVNGLLGKAGQIRRQTGCQVNQSVAAAAVDIINAASKTKMLPKWTL